MNKVMVVLGWMLLSVLSASMASALTLAGAGAEDPRSRILFDPQPEPPGFGVISWTDVTRNGDGTIALKLSLEEFATGGRGAALYFSIFGNGLGGGELGLPAVQGNEVRLTAYSAPGNESGQRMLMYTASFAFVSSDGKPFTPVVVGELGNGALVGAFSPELGRGFEFFLFEDPKTIVAGVEPSPFHGVVTFSLTNAQGATVPMNIVPEPTTLLLLGTGLVALIGYGRKRKT